MCANGYTLYQTHPHHWVSNSTYVYLNAPFLTVLDKFYSFDMIRQDIES